MQALEVSLLMKSITLIPLLLSYLIISDLILALLRTSAVLFLSAIGVAKNFTIGIRF